MSRVLREALEKCREQFLFYAKEHAKKQTEEADAKCAANMRAVVNIEEALAVDARNSKKAAVPTSLDNDDED